GPDVQESLAIRFDGFDCVTYVETVLALAAAHNEEEFREALREMRYAKGHISWHRRNHYMSDWIKNNQRRGIVKNITKDSRAVTKTRRLSIIKELPPKTVIFQAIPKRQQRRIRQLAKTGDIALFASTRRNLDVFHMGFIINHKGDLHL